ncbi:MAG: hypothetical protein LBP81_10020 [Treponema sp.]|jgi:hypothetical protein|nr:hypothetical protein [Treponema sp.]
MLVNTPVVAYFQRRCIDKADACWLSLSKKLGIQRQGEGATAHELHKPVVTDQMGEIAGKLLTNVLLIIPFETPVSAEVK